MRPAREWREELRSVPSGDVERIEGRGGEPTIRVGDVFLHSRYRPREEAARLVDSATLDPDRPVLVVGLGLGYHVRELVGRDMAVAVVEPSPAVAKLAVESILSDSDVPLGIGSPDEIAATEAFQRFAARLPQVLVHPPTARIAPSFAEAIAALASKTALSQQRLTVAVVGPIYGGSLPIAGYLERAFQRLGHSAIRVDNSIAWDVFNAVRTSVRNRHAMGQLSSLLTNTLSEWCYARVIESQCDVCIVLAQAPVGPSLPARLAKEGIVSGFWFVENWRHLTYWQDIAKHYDYFFHIQPGEFDQKLDEVGCSNHAAIMTACDPEIHKPVVLTEEERATTYGCDISFAGAAYVNRVEMFRALTDYDFKIWGVDWHAPELQPLVCGGGKRFSPEEFCKIVAGSKINLNLHSSTTHFGVDPRCDAINPRVFEIAACGGFQLCDPCLGLETLFDFDSELPAYRDRAELRTLIGHYLAAPDEGARIARNARARVLRDHTYEKRAQQMLDCLIGTHGGRILRKGVRIQRTVAEMAVRVGVDSPLGQFLKTLPPDLLFTHENINEQINVRKPPLTYPEKVFAYLQEVRNSAEMLMEPVEP